MSRLSVPKLPDAASKEPFLRDLVRFLTDYLRQIQQQLNGISEGVATSVNNATTDAPTGAVQAYAQGDFVLNSTPSELGSAGSKYIVHGWRCVASGAPGTWVEVRTLTGN